VLGIEQMDMELREQAHAPPGALDTLAIISEQSQVVSRILNDVLSMQKIEDGALTLEYDVFSLEKVRGHATRCDATRSFAGRHERRRAAATPDCARWECGASCSLILILIRSIFCSVSFSCSIFIFV